MKTGIRRTITLAVFWPFALFIFSSAACCQEVTLSWQQPDDHRVTGYNIYYGPSGTNFKAFADISIYNPGQTSCVISDLIAGQAYDFAATSFDSQGNESDFSETIHHYVTSRDSKENDTTMSDTTNGNQSGSGGGGCFISSLIY